MCTEFKKNRSQLVKLIYSLDSFTKKDLVATLRQHSGGSIVIDGQQTIGNYLSELSERGVLEKNFGKYSVNKIDFPD